MPDLGTAQPDTGAARPADEVRSTLASLQRGLDLGRRRHGQLNATATLKENGHGPFRQGEQRQLADGELRAQHARGEEQAVAVSSDGLLIALSSHLERAAADELAAIITGIRALSHGTANQLAKGQVLQVLIEMSNAYLFVSAISGGSTLGVVGATRTATWAWSATRSHCSWSVSGRNRPPR